MCADQWDSLPHPLVPGVVFSFETTRHARFVEDLARTIPDYRLFLEQHGSAPTINLVTLRVSVSVDEDPFPMIIALAPHDELAALWFAAVRLGRTKFAYDDLAVEVATR